MFSKLINIIFTQQHDKENIKFAKKQKANNIKPK